MLNNVKNVYFGLLYLCNAPRVALNNFIHKCNSVFKIRIEAMRQMYSSYSSRTNGCTPYIISHLALLNTCSPYNTKNVLPARQKALHWIGQKRNAFTLSGRILGIKRGRQLETIQSLFLLNRKMQMSVRFLYFIPPKLEYRYVTATYICDDDLLPSVLPHHNTGKYNIFLCHRCLKTPAPFLQQYFQLC